MAALELGSPSAAAVTRAGLALRARSPGLSLGLKKQHKAGSHLPLTVLFLLPFVQSWREDFFPLLFCVAHCHFSHAHTPLSIAPLGSGRGQKRNTILKPEAL